SCPRISWASGVLAASDSPSTTAAWIMPARVARSGRRSAAISSFRGVHPDPERRKSRLKGQEGPGMASISSYVVRDVIGLEANATCRQAAELMSGKHIGAVAVMQDGRIVGLITERDLVTRIVSRGLDCQTPILEAMRRDVPVVGPDLNEVECANL